MRIRKEAFGVALAAAWVSFGSPSAWPSDETNREIARTFANYYLKERDYRPGYTILADHLRGDPKDGAAWNLLGLIYLEAAQYQYAHQAFSQAITNASDEHRGIYLYNDADALARAGDEPGARSVLERIGKKAELAGPAEDALAVLKAGKPLPLLQLDLPGSWNASVSMGSGYDTNVLLSSDGNLLGTVARSDTASPQLTTVGQLGYSKPYGDRMLDTRALLSYSYYSTTEAQQYNSLLSSLAVDYGEYPSELSRFSSRITNKFDLSFLNTDGMEFYNWVETLGWKGFLKHGSRSSTEIEAPVGYQLFGREDSDDAADDRSGFTLAPALTHKRGWGGSTVSLGLRYERIFARGDNYNSHALILPLSWSRPLFWSMAGGLGLEPSWLLYLDSSSGRKDTGLKASFSLGRNFGRSISGFLEYSFRRNLSNVDSATYSKHSFLLLVNYAIL